MKLFPLGYSYYLLLAVAAIPIWRRISCVACRWEMGVGQGYHCLSIQSSDSESEIGMGFQAPVSYILWNWGVGLRRSSFHRYARRVERAAQMEGPVFQASSAHRRASTGLF